jgi:hypothetical protein
MVGPILVTTHRTHPAGMITTPKGPTFVKNNGQSGARSGDHTHCAEQSNPTSPSMTCCAE